MPGGEMPGGRGGGGKDQGGKVLESETWCSVASGCFSVQLIRHTLDFLLFSS